jgi:hypothetical protein
VKEMISEMLLQMKMVAYLFGILLLFPIKGSIYFAKTFHYIFQIPFKNKINLIVKILSRSFETLHVAIFL